MTLPMLSDLTDVRLNVNARLPTSMSAAVPRGRVGRARGGGTAAATSLRNAAMEEVPTLSVETNVGNPAGGVMSPHSVVSAGVNRSGSTTSLGASVQS